MCVCVCACVCTCVCVRVYASVCVTVCVSVRGPVWMLCVRDYSSSPLAPPAPLAKADGGDMRAQPSASLSLRPPAARNSPQLSADGKDAALRRGRPSGLRPQRKRNEDEDEEGENEDDDDKKNKSGERRGRCDAFLRARSDVGRGLPWVTVTHRC